MAVKREDRIDEAYEQRLSPTRKNLEEAEGVGSEYVNQGIDQAESYANDPANAIQEKEENRNDGWLVNRNSFEKAGGVNPPFNLKAAAKKGGPVGLIIGLVLGLAGVVSFFGGPGLLIVNFVEQYTNAFNTQLASTDARMSKIVHAKMKNTVRGNSLVGKKYSTFSKKELDNFRKFDLTPIGETETFTGRYKITGLQKLDGKTITASTFNKELRGDVDFRNAINKSYGGVGGLKYLGLWDRVANNYKTARGIVFNRPFRDGSTDEDRQKVADDLSKGKTQTTGDVPNRCTGRVPACSEAEQRAADEEAAKANDDASKFNEEAKKYGDTTESASSKLSRGALDGGTFFRSFGALGFADSACSFIGFARAAGVVTKTTRLQQMMLYSTIFLTTATMIKVTAVESKSADVSPEDVSFVGDLLTQTFSSPNGTTTKAATDSFGYRNAAYGDTGIDEAASPFIAGASFGGAASTIMGLAISALTSIGRDASSIKAIAETCKFVNNPLVIIGSLIAGFAMLFIPGVNIGKLGSQAAISGALLAGQAIILAKLSDISNGILVGKNDSREGVGNIMNVATSAMLMGIGNKGGNPILTKAQQRSVMAHYTETKLAYAEMERLNHSPFDATNQNTFLGSIYTKMMPHIASIRSGSGILKSIASIHQGTLTSFAPATALADTSKGCEEQDPDLKDAGFATTEFCIPWTGTDPKYLDIEPMAAVDYLVNNGFLDENTDTFTEKAKPFIDACIERDEMSLPFGYSGDNFDQENGKNCIIDDTKVSYFSPTGEVKAQLAVSTSDVETIANDAKVAIYIHTQDMRNADVLENGLPKPPVSAAATSSGYSGPGTATPFDAKKVTDPSIACPAGTKDLGTVKTRYSGVWPIQTDPYPTIRLCQLSSITGGGNDALGNPTGDGAVVNAGAAANFQLMGEKAKTDNTPLRASSSFRLADSCGGTGSGGFCAAPGQSLHQLGLAVDFGIWDWGQGSTYSSGGLCNSRRAVSNDPMYPWLRSNASEGFEILQYSEEAWHWQYLPEANNSCRN